MSRLFLILLFILPFQARIHKLLRPLSRSWINPDNPFPTNFEPFAELFLSDFFLIALLIGLFCLRKNFSWGLEQKAATAFLAVALLSLLLQGATPGISYWRLAQFALVVTLLYQAFPRFKTVAITVVCSAVLQCGIALAQYCMQHQLGLKTLGEPTLLYKGDEIGANIWMPKKSVTTFDYYLGPDRESGKVLRATGTLPHPNLLATFLVFSLFMTLFLYEETSKKRWMGVVIALQIVTLFATYSRAGLFAFVGGAFLWGLLHFWQEKKVPAVFKPLTIALLGSLLLFFPQLFHRGGVFSHTKLSAQSDETRVEMHEVALRIIRDHPWFGVGFNNYHLALPRYGGPPIAVHNIYLLIAAETGLTGLFFFLLFCSVIVLRGWQVRHLPQGRIALAMVLAFLATGAVHFDIVLKHQISEIFFLTAALTAYLFRSTHVFKSGSSQCDLAGGGRV